MSLFSATADRIASLFGYTKVRAEEVVKYGTREGLYVANQLLYDGRIYDTRANGGALEDVLKRYIGAAYTDPNRFPIVPWFMPFGTIVDAYLNVLPGTWGHEVKIASEFDGKPVNPKLEQPISRIWRDSNFDTEKSTLIRWAANFGTVGARITAEAAQGDKPARVTLMVDHPGRLFNFEEDARGNVTAVCLKYAKSFNFGTLSDPDWQSVDVVEEMDKDGFSVTHDGRQQLTAAQRKNTLGFTPYLILRHRTNESPYGDWAYKGAEALVHRINWRISRQDKSIDRHQFPRWFGAAGGKQPTSTLDMGDDKMTYVQTSPDTPPPMIQAIVPNIDQASAMEFWQDLRDLFRIQRPEMNLNDVKLIAGISGETLAQALKPTEQAIVNARPNYLHAVVRLFKMAVSAGVVIGAWDVGTGTGSSEAGDRAYREGLEEFEFSPQPALPLTPLAKTQEANAQQADKTARFGVAKTAEGMVSHAEQLRLAGYDEADAAKIEGEQALDDAEDLLNASAAEAGLF